MYFTYMKTKIREYERIRKSFTYYRITWKNICLNDKDENDVHQVICK